MEASHIDVSLKAAEYLERAMSTVPRAHWNPLPHQIPPSNDFYGWLLLAGRGAGKTDTCAKYVVDHVNGPPCMPGPVPHWIGIIAPTLGDAATACFSGPSGIRAHDDTAKMGSFKGGLAVRWPNGSVAKLFGARSPDDVDRLRAGGNRCVVGSTLIETADGTRPIQTIRTGDRVWTRGGLRRVMRAGLSRRNAKIWRLEASDGVILEGTADHEIMTQRGWVQLQFLQPNDTLTRWQQLSNTMVSDGTDVKTAISRTHAVDSSIGTFGASTTVVYPTATTYTTGTKIARGTASVISNYSRRQSTHVFIPDVTSVCRTHERDARRGNTASSVRFIASTVTVHFGHEPSESQVIDAAIARIIGTPKEAFPHEHVRNGCALCAITGSSAPSGPRPEPVQCHVVRCLPAGRTENVYDLAVEHDHEFFANGVLVANCLAWLEELAAWRYLDDCWDQMRFGLRTGARPHWVGSTTPKPRQLIKKIATGQFRGVQITRATMYDNPYLPDSVKQDLEDTYGGTTLGAQELYGRIVEQDENALWQRANLERDRVIEAPPLKRISVGIDPSGGRGEQGIVAVGKFEQLIAPTPEQIAQFGTGTGAPHAWAQMQKTRKDTHGYVLADYSCRLSPDGWGRRSVQCAIDTEADDIVVETNFGGDMAVAVIQGAVDAAGVSIPVRTVTASRGKRVRAEPVAAMSAREKWHHVGVFEELEDQQCTWSQESDYSPDRLDAMVWPAWHQKMVRTTQLQAVGSWGGSAMNRKIG